MFGWLPWHKSEAPLLIIGVTTERDRIAGLMKEFDRNANAIRKEIEEEAK